MPFCSILYENWQNEKAVCLPLLLDLSFLHFFFGFTGVSVLDFQPALISIAPLQVMELEGRKDLFSWN